MENSFDNGPKVLVAQVSEADRVAFYKKTYAHVGGGILLFIVFEYLFLQSASLVEFALSMTQGYKWLLLLGGFMLITNYAESTALKTSDKNLQYLAYSAYIFAEAFIFIPLIYMAIMYTNSLDLIKQAGIVTLGLFTGISSIVFITKKDFSFIRAGLTVGFFIAIGLIIAGALFGFNLGLWFSVGMCVLAAGSILYQTSNLVHKFSTDDYIPAALGLFASLMLLFWYVLQIFMSRD
ncbi:MULTISPECIES: Bax inhibitor-1 family protein [Tenacibaculum]|nr:MULTISPECIES: Bax inhibitor-1 family protein [Tenacibaculum]MCF2876056.1 Bax inhibitor-1 family protein [Tenacibaculum sp. Cn5-1]MCF2936131.1 Bax inhibitor-1 family protein [Tenacibaculum sp. Cn5-34]MCG7512692.1 Bax inhibitor-1 family protein [Tenacibaculum sp. Cn5-46]